MASTYSQNLRLELIGTGEQQGTWGTTTNTNLGTLLEEAIGGYVSVTVSDVGDTTLTSNNGLADQSRNMVLNLTGTISANRNVICPAIEKIYVVKNNTTGGFSVTLKVSGQTGVSVPNGLTYFVYVDGADVRMITGSLANQLANSVSITGGTITGITDLAVADGGTGVSTITGIIKGNGTSAFSEAVAGVDYIAPSSLGTMSTQNANSVSITGGSISGITSLAVADGGTGASTITGIIKGNGTSAFTAAVAGVDYLAPTSLGTMSTQNANSVSITGGSITGVSGLLTSGPVTTSGLTQTTSRVLGRTTSGTGAIEELTVGSGITLSAGSLSVTPNTYQPLDADLTAIAALSTTDGNFIVGNGSTWVAESGATARTSLGLGTGDSPQFTAVNIGSATDTTITRVSAGVVAVEGATVATLSATQTFTGFNTFTGLSTTKTAITSPVSTDGNIYSGTYTPTLTNVTNVASSTATLNQYMRVGDIVTVSGRITIDPTSASTLTELRMSLPFSASFNAVQRLGGTFARGGAASGNAGSISADTTNNVAFFSITPSLDTSQAYSFSFTYNV